MVNILIFFKENKYKDIYDRDQERMSLQTNSDIGHTPNLEAPEAFNQIILQFLSAYI